VRGDLLLTLGRIGEPWDVGVDKTFKAAHSRTSGFALTTKSSRKARRGSNARNVSDKAFDRDSRPLLELFPWSQRLSEDSAPCFMDFGRRRCERCFLCARCERFSWCLPQSPPSGYEKDNLETILDSPVPYPEPMDCPSPPQMLRAFPQTTLIKGIKKKHQQP